MTQHHRVTVTSQRSFGRRPLRSIALPMARLAAPVLSAELRLFALTFAGGFLFMTVYLA